MATERRMAIAALFLLATIAALAALRPVGDPDTPWHLFQGLEVFRAGGTSYVDRAAYTVPGKSYVNQPWLGEAVMLAFYEAGGWAGLSVYAALCAFSSALLVGWVALGAAGPRVWLGVLVAALSAAVTAWRFEARPLALFLVLLPGSLLLADRYARATERRSALLAGAALALTQVAWSQIHGSYVLLPALAGLAVAARWRALAPRALAARGALPFFLGVFVLLVPGAAGHMDLIGNVVLGDATEHIAEMRPLKLGQLLPSHLNSILFLDLLLLLGAARSVLRRGARLDDLGRAALGAALAFTASRFRGVWGVLLVPWAARVEPGSEGAEAWPRERLFALLAVLLAVPLVTANAVDRDPTRGFGPGIHRDNYVVDSADALERWGVEGNLFNFYDDGGYLQLRLAPRVRVAIDGRTPTLFDDELYYLVRRAQVEQAAFESFVEAFPTDMVLLRIDSPLCAVLEAAPGWRPVYFERRRAAFFRDGFRPDVPTLRALSACAPEAGVLAACREPNEEGAGRGELAAELARLLALTPEAPHLLTMASVHAAACEGQPARAVDLAERAVDAGTRHPGAFMGLARAQAMAGDFTGAVWALDMASALGAKAEARRLLALVARQAGDTEAALRALGDEVAAAGDLCPPELRLEYAAALAEAGRVAEARLHAQRVLWVTRSTEARALLERLGDGP